MKNNFTNFTNKPGHVNNINDAEKIGVNYKLSSEEREIILIMDDKDRKWKASVSSPTYMRKFERQGWTCTGTEYYSDGTVCTKFFEAPYASSITIGKAERTKRQGKPLSEEHKKKLLAGRAAKMTQNKDNNTKEPPNTVTLMI